MATSALPQPAAGLLHAQKCSATDGLHIVCVWRADFFGVAPSCRYVIYHGPVSAVQQHFEGLGFDLPERMDVPSWLVELTTPQGMCGLTELCNIAASICISSAQQYQHFLLVSGLVAERC